MNLIVTLRIVCSSSDRELQAKSATNKLQIRVSMDPVFTINTALLKPIRIIHRELATAPKGIRRISTTVTMNNTIQSNINS